MLNPWLLNSKMCMSVESGGEALRPQFHLTDRDEELGVNPAAT